MRLARIIALVWGLGLAGCGGLSPSVTPMSGRLAAADDSAPLTEYTMLDMKAFADAVGSVQFSLPAGRQHLGRRYGVRGRLYGTKSHLAAILQSWGLRIDDPEGRAWAPLRGDMRFFSRKQALKWFGRIGAAPAGTPAAPVTVFVTMNREFRHFNGTQANPYDACRIDAVALADGSIVRP